MLNGQAHNSQEGVSVLCVCGGSGGGWQEDAFSSMLICYLSLRVPHRSLSTSELLMKEPDPNNCFEDLVFVCFGNNSLKSLNTHLASQWLTGAMS